MTLDTATLLCAAIASPDAVVEVCRGATEEERRAVAPEVIAWFRERNPYVPWRVEVGDAAAVIAVITFEEFKKLKLLECGVAYGQPVVELLADRRPRWLSTWAEKALERQLRGGRAAAWPAVRRLIRRGVLERPTSDAYTLLMINGIGHLGRDHRGAGEERVKISDVLWRDGLAEHEVWRLFEVEGRVRPGISLTTFGEPRWRPALITLAGDGRIDRDRLISANLGALASGFTPYNNRWYLELHDELELTDEERRRHARELTALLRQHDPQVVKMGISEAAALGRLRAVAPEDVAHPLTATIARLPKAIAREALVLLRGLTPRPHSASAAAAALIHPDTDVQADAIELLESLTELDQATTDALKAASAMIAATLSDRVRRLVGGQSISAPAESVPEDLAPRIRRIDERWRLAAGVDWPDTPVSPDRRALPLDPDGVIQPTECADEVIDLLTRLIEDANDPDEVELALDGLACFGAELYREAGWGPSPLRKRALAIVRQSGGGERRHLERLLANAVLELNEASGDRVHGSVYPSARIKHVQELVRARRSERLLALPTHRGGLIDARVFAERVRHARETEVSAFDATVGLLRLVQVHGTEALASLQGIDGAFAAATRYALGANELPDDQQLLWAAAAHARDPDGTTVTDAAPYPILFLTQNFGRGSFARWMAIAWPTRREAYYGVAASDPYFDFDDRDDWGMAGYLPPLLEGDEPVGPMARALLVRSLSAKAATMRLPAIDIVVAAVEEGRIVGPELGDTVARYWHAGSIVPARLAGALTEIARVSRLHADAVRRVIEQAVTRGVPSQGAYALLELLLEVASRLGTGVTDEVARGILASLQGSSKAARAGRAAADLPRGAKPADVTHEALAARVSRAERYQAWVETRS